MNKIKQEFPAYFKTPAAYVYGALILVVAGVYTIHYNITGGLSNFEYALNDSAFIFVVLAPLLTYFVHHRLHRQEEGSSLYERTLATAPVLLLLVLCPSVVLILYPLVLKGFGALYFPTAMSQIVAFFFLGLVSVSCCLLCAVTEKKPLPAALFSLGAHLLAFVLAPVSTSLATPYASMLIFTAVIALIGFALYRVTRHGTLTLAAIVLLEVLQVLFFVTKQESFTYLAEAVFSLLSPFARFSLNTGGILDIPGLLYFASIAIVLAVLSAGAASLRDRTPDNVNKETEETPGDTADEDTPKFRVVKPLIIFGAALVLNLFILLFTRGKLIVDTSETKLFTLPKQLEDEIEQLKSPVTVHWIVETGAEDVSMRTALYVYGSRSLRLHIRRLNPSLSEDFIRQNTIEDIYNNGLLVMGSGRTRYINFSDIYGYDYSRYDQIGTYDLTFRLEDLLDHALEFLAGSEISRIYATTGHDEGTLPDYYNTLFQKEDVEIVPFEISNGIPEDAAGLLILGPANDFTEDEADILSKYLSGGGRLLLVTRLHLDGHTTPVLESVMLEYGAVMIPGVVIESSSNAYNSKLPYVIQPSVLDHPVNKDMISARKAPVFEIAQGIVLMPLENVKQSPLLTTSSESFCKIAGYQSTSYEPEEGDVVGIQNVAAALETDAGTRIVWITSGSVVQTEQNSESGGGNQYFLMGAVKWTVPSISHTEIPFKIYNYGILRVAGDNVSRIGMLLTFLVPFLYLCIGLGFLYAKKRRETLQKEAEAEEQRRLEEERQRQEEEEEAKRREAFRKAREEAARAARESAKAAAKKAAEKKAAKQGKQ